jgi:LPPG:FO 2-phospho-L-lactate transferase
MKKLGQPVWFNVGDRDLALHLCRTKLLHEGKTLTEATAEIASQLGIRSRILPMCNAHVETRVDTPIGELSFQEYFVQRWYQDPVNSVRFAGIENVSPAPGVIDCIMSASVILLAPSNPMTSIGPILAVPGVRTALRSTPATIAAVSPIIGDAAVSGPAGILMAAHGFPVSIAGVAEAYKDFLDVLIVDDADRAAAADLQKSGVRVQCTSTVMKRAEDKIKLARVTLAAAGENSRLASG